MSSFDDTLKTAASAMTAQTLRLRTISENIANANSTAATAGADPYRRKLVTFKNVLDHETGSSAVKVDRIVPDAAPFELKYMPGHPAADGNGYVRMPNVNPLVEMGDLREAQRSYQANVDVIDATNTMISRAIDMLRS
ncbi:MAG TPA: flagellar basal body rod protein FlgC [Aliidongia sp.]|uniref:flagellar basal body rod protein FlgC n=1 Tax=Aliidongia sp. TaxID=1914230 RepID=UPI002DDD35B6|nr:flagellar basal body rod protein FlgC [Aliidongia sp.]HEV2674229.1 flagellar basal body rod protein FlgC [Aliidongia sp.]